MRYAVANVKAGRSSNVPETPSDDKVEDEIGESIASFEFAEGRAISLMPEEQ